MGYNTVTVTTTATEIVAANSQRKDVDIANTDAGEIVYIGPDSSVTTSNAIPLYPQQTRDKPKMLSEHWKGPIFGIVGTGTADVRYWEVTQ